MRQMETGDYYTIQVEPAEDILPESLGIPSVLASSLFVQAQQPQRRQLPAVPFASEYKTVGPNPTKVPPFGQYPVNSQGHTISSSTGASQQHQADLSLFIFLLTLIVLGVLGGIGFGYLISVTSSLALQSPLTSHVVVNIMPAMSSFLSGGH